MYNIWNSNIQQNYYRKGVRLRFDKNVDLEVKRSCKEFIMWIRREYEFPIRLVIYFKDNYLIKNKEGKQVSATFLAPYEKDIEPYAKIAVGDFGDLIVKYGKDNALAAILTSIAHEITHYFQWINDKELEEKQAIRKANQIIFKYSQVREHP